MISYVHDCKSLTYFMITVLLYVMMRRLYSSICKVILASECSYNPCPFDIIGESGFVRQLCEAMMKYIIC